MNARIELSRGYMKFRVAMGILLTVTAAAYAFSGFFEPEMSGRVVPVLSGSIASILFAVLSVGLSIRMLVSRPAIIMNDQGIIDQSGVFDRVVPWSAFRKLGVNSMCGTRVLSIQIDPSQQTRLIRMSCWPLSSLVMIPQRSVTVPLEELTELLRAEHAMRHPGRQLEREQSHGE